MVGGSSGSAVFICKRCNNKVVNGLKCCICHSIFHLSCAKKSKGIEVIDENTVKCCIVGEVNSDGKNSDELLCDALDKNIVQSCSNVNGRVNPEDSALSDDLFQFVDSDGKIDFKIIKYIFNQKEYILNQKEQIINELRDKIDILTNHVELLNKFVKVNDTLSKDNNHVVCSDKVILNTTTQLGKEKVDDIISQHQVSSNVHSSASSKKIDFVNKTVSDINSDNIDTSFPVNNDKELFTTVVKRKQNRKVVVGKDSNGDPNLCNLKGVPRFVSLHVYRLSPETRVEHLVNYLKPRFPEVKCEQLNSKHPEEYASFKVDIFDKNLDKALDGNIWPSNARVRRYFLYPINVQQQREKQ